MPRPRRSDRAIDWVEDYCLIPAGPDKGQRVKLTVEQRRIIRQIYDHPNDKEAVPVGGPLAAYLALLHTAGPEALQRKFCPALSADLFTTWNAVGPDLRAVLKRDGEGIKCPELGTRYPAAA